MRTSLLALLLVGCAFDPAPPQPATATPDPVATIAAGMAPSSSAAPEGSTTAPAPSASAQASAQAPTEPSAAPPPEPAAPEEPVLVDDDGELLPQTKDQPSVESALFQHHLDLLWKAIVADDPEIARPFFFPKAAYLKVKAIKDPGTDWERRLWKLFVRDVHEYHGKLGEDPHAARFVRLDFEEKKVHWMKKHKEGNAIGYYRVKRPYLVFEDAEGDEHRLEITAMISWRGEWYVVHLHGFK